MIFGWNSYLLKAFILGNFGVTDPAISSIPIEYRQRYFHLMFIPCIPLGKFWAIRRDGKLYEPANDLLQVLNAQRVSTRNGVWAWSGVLAALLIYFGYNINQKLDNRRYEKHTAMQKSLIHDFAADKAKTAPLLEKARRLGVLLDSFAHNIPAAKSRIDTNKAIGYYLEALATQGDSLTGYTEENTYIYEKKLRDFDRPLEYTLATEAKEVLETEGGSYPDTASFFKKMRKLESVKYLFVMTEYNRLDPVVTEDAFNSGYSMNMGQLVDIATGKCMQKVKFFITNSESVSTVTYSENGRGQVSRSEWRTRLDGDLNMNIHNAVRKYLFNEDMDALRDRARDIQKQFKKIR